MDATLEQEAQNGLNTWYRSTKWTRVLPSGEALESVLALRP